MELEREDSKGKISAVVEDGQVFELDDGASRVETK